MPLSKLRAELRFQRDRLKGFPPSLLPASNEKRARARAREREREKESRQRSEAFPRLLWRRLAANGRYGPM